MDTTAGLERMAHERDRRISEVVEREQSRQELLPATGVGINTLLVAQAVRRADLRRRLQDLYEALEP